LNSTYKFDIFSNAFVCVLAAEQTEDSPDWFQGTADAVRQSLRHLRSHPSRDVLILSGDQLYQMDFRKMQETHRRHVADATVAVTPVPAEQTVDFGRHAIPKALGEMRVTAHFYRGYWEDVGTIGSYFHANLALCEPVPPFDFYDASRPVYTHPRFLPATKVQDCTLKSVLISEGSILVGAEIDRALVGIRSRIGQGARLRNSLVLGADYYETIDEIERANARGVPPLGIGADTGIERALVDQNARLGRG